MSGSHALVIGASGLIGWGVVNQLLRSYPSTGTFSKVTALVNRPLKLEDVFWPTDGPELELISGIDLLSSDEELEQMILEKLEDVKSIRYVFYFGKFLPIACRRKDS